MLPTPSTSHVPYARVYEPAEDSFLLLDTLSSASETAFLAARFPSSSSPPSSSSSSPSSQTLSDSDSRSAAPLVLEVGPGSGVVLAFLTAHAQVLFSRRDILTLGIDVNRFACAATSETVAKAPSSNRGVAGYHLGTAQGDLATAVRPGTVDVLVFNPPYVPTPDLPPVQPEGNHHQQQQAAAAATAPSHEEDSRLLALSYAGGRDGMEVTDRLIEALPEVLSARGVAYLLLCAQNKPEEVKGRIRRLAGGPWRAETVGTSGRQAGWEKLQIVRIWRE
ncbi:hypothetical protein MYCTH_44053 [Thermothelomyces thermophilus ATCC 42464]|uniref:Methyltransferase small domain-containing protein n=1 Tax=Thermothelomyces thermophilus (strain ATCC 42464 / BCRC 31852 / DSM 1799) TaxID=573729 RepID=G2Q3S6_THET4|nr:uncharacterized protein MYCTH_44053 [Thermothelomyces thermophilus ATCC 42464]AEO54429.1 hypothetical protein MYCTH_44053 [Thermothelomyces thermophilus ATCC 42464]